MCREFQRGNCARGEIECRFAHPSDSPMIDTADNTVTVCMDYIKSRCSREKCKYFHPPAHLQAKLKYSQQQISQTAAAGQTATVVRHHCLSVCVDGLGLCCVSIWSIWTVQIEWCADLLGLSINATQSTEVRQMWFVKNWILCYKSTVICSCAFILKLLPYRLQIYKE